MAKKKSYAEWMREKQGITTDTRVVAPTAEDLAEEDSWLKAGAFDDGYQFGDLTASLLSTAGDVASGVAQGILGLGEGVLDLGTHILSGAAGLVGWEDGKNALRDAAQYGIVENAFNPIDDFFDENSFLGNKTEGIEEGLGQVAAIMLTGGAAAAGGFSATAATTGMTLASSWGSGINEAYAGGATDAEAWGYGAISGLVDAGTELLFGGLGKTVKAVGLSKGISSLDDMFAKKLSSKISSTFAKNLVQFGVKSAAEGVEEVLAGIGSAIGKKMTYMSEEDLGKLIEDENLLEQFVVGSVTAGISQSGLVPGMKKGSLIDTTKKGEDFVTNLTQNEQKVVDKEVEKRVAEKEKRSGKELTNKEKNAIYDQVIEDLDNGAISIDTIEEVLGGDSYKAYQDAVASDKALIDEYEELGKKQGATLAEQERFRELHGQMKDIKADTRYDDLRGKLAKSAFETVAGDRKGEGSRLMSSYLEANKRGKAFEADVNSYDEKYRATVQRAIDSGILNNSRRTHEFVEILAKIEADKGVKFDFLNNEKLKGTSFARDDAFVNGYYDSKSKTIGVNIDSAKAWQTTVGHEVTHVLEGTELYGDLQKALFEYAEAKGELKTRREALAKLYDEKDIDSELAADLVGDYLFTDKNFVTNLSKNKKLFQRVFDEIKYLWKVATAGSKEKRQLEEIKHLFEQVYKADVKANKDTTNFSLSEQKTPTYEELVAKDPMQIISVTEGIESGTYAEMKKAALDKATAEGWFDAPHHNADTDSLIFLTEKSFTHAYTNLTADFGEDTIRCMAHIPEIIKEAVLVDVANPKSENRREKKVYTFFGAVEGKNGIEPVKLTVKEFDFSSMNALPKNIRSYFEKNGISDSYNSLYDTHALEVIGIEGIKKELDASGEGNGKTPQAQSTSNSTISIADLLNLVKGDAEKYIPQKTKFSLSSNNTNVNGAEYNGKEFWIGVADLNGNIVQTWTYEEAESRGFDLDMDAIFNDKLRDGYRFFTTDLIEDNGRIEFDDYGDRLPDNMIERINEQIKVKPTTKPAANIDTATLMEYLNESLRYSDSGSQYKDVSSWVEGEGARSVAEDLLLDHATEYGSNIPAHKWVDALFESGLDEDAVLERVEMAISDSVNGGTKYSLSTEITPMAKPKDGFGFDPTKANLQKDLKTVRAVRSETMLKNGYTEEDVTEVNRFMDNLATFMEKAGVTYKFIGLDDVNNAKLKVTYDKKGNPKKVTMSAMVKNGEYPVNFDFTRICKKRESMSMVIKELAKRKTADGRRTIDTINLNAEALWTINEELRLAGLETACLGCFVESKRYNIQAFANKAVRMWNSIVDEVRRENGAEGEAESFNFAEGINLDNVDYGAIEKIFADYNTVKGRTSPEARMRALIRNGGELYQRHLQPSDLMTPEGIESIKAMSTKKNDFYGILKGVYGQAAPKEVTGFSPYNSEVALLPKKKNGKALSEYVASIGGVRMQSFSDFLVANVYDYMQMVADLSARHLPAHAYTKEIAFAKIFGMTGVKINMSVMFDIDPNLPGEYAGLQFVADENGDEIFNGVKGRWDYLVGDKKRSDAVYEATGDRPYVQSIGFDEAVALQSDPRYSKNCGIIGVGMSDRHIRMMLDDGRIRYIIPYHSSSLPAVIAEVTNIKMARDYTDFQNTRRIVSVTDSTGKAVDLKALREQCNSWSEVYSLLQENVAIAGWDVQMESDANLAGRGGFDIYKDLETTQNPKQSAENYLQYCAENGYMPVFEQFAFHENYYKLLYDFDPYDSVTGEYAPQTEVKNIYSGYNPAEGFTSTETVEKIINDEMKKQNDINKARNEVMPSVVDNVLEQLGVEHNEVGVSVGDAEGDSTVQASLSAEGETPTQYGDFYTPANELGFDAPVAEDIAPVDKAVDKAVDEDDWVSKDIAPVAENAIDTDIIPNETRVYAGDRGNVGTVKGYNEETNEYSVFFKAKNGNTATVNISADDISPLVENKTDEELGEEAKVARVLEEEPEVPKEERKILNKIRANFVDKGSVVEDLALKTGNRELDAKYNFMHYSESRAQSYIAKHLKPIVDAVEKTGKQNEFETYAYHLHNIDRMSLESKAQERIAELKGKFGLLRIDQIKAIAATKITEKTTERTAQTIREAKEYLKALETKNKPVYGDSVTADVSREEVKRLEAENPEFKELVKAYTEYNNALRKMLVDGGVISQQTADLWAQMYPHYMPIRRDGKSKLGITVPLDTNKTGVNAPIKQATGGNSDILPLRNTMAIRTEQTFKAIARNSFGVELMHTLDSVVDSESASVDEVLDGFENHEELLKEGKRGQNPTFTVFENGQRVTFEITNDMYDALKPTSEGLKYTNKALSKLNNLRRGLITEFNPAFMLTNPIKDAQDVLMNSQHAWKTYKNFPKAIAELWGKGKWYTEYMENGGEDNTYFDGKTNTFTKEDTGIKRLIGIPLNKISAANNFIERIPRLAEYIASRESGASIEGAMLDAARVTTNFAAGGDVTKMLNRNGATFLNASVQGAAQQVRNLREAKAQGLKGWVKLATKFAVAGLPAVLLNHLLWGDDEEYEELSDYVKDNYYIVAKYGDGQFVRIPKGRTLAVIQDAFEQVGNAMTGNDEVDLANFLELAISNLAPNNPLDNNLIAPLSQAISNKTWYGEDLVPTRLQDLPEGEQFDESTDALSKWLGETLNISPYKINYVLDQYSGALGDIFLPMWTPEADGGGILAPLADKFTTDSVLNNQNVADFYDKVDELTKYANSSKATDADVLASKYMNSVNAELGDLYKQKREIQNSDLPDNEKYAAIRELQAQINALAKESLNAYGNVKVIDGYASVGDRYYKQGDDGKWTKLTDKQVAKLGNVVTALNEASSTTYWRGKSESDFASSSPGQYAVAKSIGGYEAYKSYSTALDGIKADTNSNGKTISGSRKAKVIDYINNLDADYGTKILLYKNEYKSDNTYNYDIIEYLNSRKDITYKDMEAILKELGFHVDDEGNIYWY